MIKRVIIGVLGVSVIAVLVALMGSESARATDNYRCVGPPTTSTHCNPKLHCEYTISGVLRHGCFSADPGSVDFFVELFGVPGSLTGKSCTEETCLAMRCSIYGTVDLGDPECVPNPAEGRDCVCDATTLDPDCGITGDAFCKNKGGNFQIQGQPFTLAEPLTDTASFKGNCNKSGRCKDTIQVDATLPDDICVNRNWEFLTFVASEFNGGCCTCDGGYDTDTLTPGTCCADSQRNLDGSCFIEGDESCNNMRCTTDLSNFDPTPGAVNAPYECGPIPQNP